MKDGDDLKLNVIPVFACSGRESNPYGHFCPQDFLTTLAFAQAGFISVLLSRCSLDYFLTMHVIVFRSSPYSLYAIGRSGTGFREPSPKRAFLSARFLFVRGVLLTRFPL